MVNFSCILGACAVLTALNQSTNLTFRFTPGRSEAGHMSAETNTEELFESKNQGYVEVIIPLALPLNYTWSVPEALIDKVKPGCRAEVVLRNKKYAGIIKRLHYEKPDGFDPKPILNILD